MAILSMKEFSESMSISYDTVKKNAQRGNIIKGTNGKIDTENATNKLFFDKQMALNSTKIDDKKESKKETTQKKERVRSVEPSLTKTQKEFASIDLRTRTATMELRERESELKKMELEKRAGNLLPVELVNRVIVLTVQTIFKSFDVGLDNMARISVDRFGGTRKDLAEITTQQRLLLSKLIDNAKENTRIEIDNAIDEYQETKK